MDSRATQIWLTQMQAWRHYFRYSVEGLEHLDSKRSIVAVGYHGRPLAWDLLILHEVLYRRHGRMHFGIFHEYFERDPFARWMLRGLEWTTRDGPEVVEAIHAGRHLILAPGGDREATRPWHVHNRVDWGLRSGFVRLAIRHGLEVVPIAAAGVDDAYIGLNDGFDWGRRLGLPHRLPAWLALGPLGLHGFSPPFPVKIHQIIGAPIDLDEFRNCDLDDRDAMTAASLRVQAAVQGLLDRAEALRHRPRWRFMMDRPWRPRA
jgi:1-acyl-sn-glycerol-3-phosphate acyltransferase